MEVVPGFSGEILLKHLSPNPRIGHEDVLQRTAEQQAQHEREIDKQNEAIRSLFVVARTVERIKELREREHGKRRKRSTLKEQCR